tara:strand:+ start:3685 stop:4422 length:738 start_codon:yes stop_codon:yes gene_type:complete
MLPKIDAPKFDIDLPVSEIKVKVRPFTVKEEKILLFAQQDNKEQSIIDAIMQVVNNCLLDKTDITKLPTYELEYLFVKLRGLSVNSIIELNVKDDSAYTEENPVYAKSSLTIDDIILKSDKKADSKLELDDKYMLKLRHPTYGSLKGFDKSTIMDSNISDLAIQLIGSVIESVYSKDGKEVFMLDDYSEEERSEFYSSLSAKNFSEIQKFIASAPYLYAKIEWEEQDGNMKERELKGLLDFFTFA